MDSTDGQSESDDDEHHRRRTDESEQKGQRDLCRAQTAYASWQAQPGRLHSWEGAQLGRSHTRPEVCAYLSFGPYARGLVQRVRAQVPRGVGTRACTRETGTRAGVHKGCIGAHIMTWGERCYHILRALAAAVERQQRHQQRIITQPLPRGSQSTSPRASLCRLVHPCAARLGMHTAIQRAQVRRVAAIGRRGGAPRSRRRVLFVHSPGQSKDGKKKLASWVCSEMCRVTLFRLVPRPLSLCMQPTSPAPAPTSPQARVMDPALVFDSPPLSSRGAGLLLSGCLFAPVNGENGA